MCCNYIVLPMCYNVPIKLFNLRHYFSVSDIDLPPLCAKIPIPPIPPVLPVPITVNVCADITDIDVTQEADVVGCIELSIEALGLGFSLNMGCHIFDIPVNELYDKIREMKTNRYDNISS